MIARFHVIVSVLVSCVPENLKARALRRIARHVSTPGVKSLQPFDTRNTENSSYPNALYPCLAEISGTESTTTVSRVASTSQGKTSQAELVSPDPGQANLKLKEAR